jgi:two-component SAPR family response regulator
MMPHITGRELLYFVRSHPELAMTHFVLMSAVSHLSRLDSKYEPDDFLVKPFDITRIDGIVQNFLPEPEEDRSFHRSIPLTFPLKPNHDTFFLSRHRG